MFHQKAFKKMAPARRTQFPANPLYPPNSSLNWPANDSVTIRFFYPNQ